MLLRVTVGGSVHPHDTSNELPVVVQPSEFLTVITWVPLTTRLKVVPDWNLPPSRLYSRPEPTGLVTVTTAFPAPCVQSTVCEGAAGEGGCSLILTFFDLSEMHPYSFVTVKV